MPHGCIYPQDTTVNEFLDDGTPNPQRCPYRTHWKPYKTSANNLCCKTQFVLKDDRAIKINTDVPATHAQFPDGPPPSPQNPRSCINQNAKACLRNKRCRQIHEGGDEYSCLPIKWDPNRNCPKNSQCTEANCLPKNSRRRVCSDKYRCVVKDGAPWRRSCRAES